MVAMAQFRFYQDKEVKTWVRDYFTVEAESLEDAIQFIKDNDTDMDKLENKCGDKVEFVMRNTEVMLNSFCEDEFSRYSVFSVDLENKYEDGEILSK